jgi:NADPH:quinone reductase-like Zn-dependent oxidoreductase
MKAIRLMEHGAPGRLEYGEAEEPEPGAGEVMVAVRACGLNRLDLWVEENALPMKLELPRIPGCEIAGEVAALGAGVEGWKAGDRVAIQSNLFCGECEFCRQGEESICLRGELLGVQRDGGFAEKVVAPGRCLVSLPEGLDFRTAAGLSLAGSTAMHMLTNRARVKEGDWVLVMGAASGVGSAAIQIAKELGGRVITTGSTESKRELGLRLGAVAAVDSTKTDWTAEVRKITEKRGVDLVIEHVGGPVLEAVWNCVARGGTVVTCGATAGRETHLNLWPIFVKQQRLVGSYGRNRADLKATLEWGAAGKLHPVLDRIYRLEETAQAYQALRNRAVHGKVLIEI